jgi:hypothetical protein
VSRFDRFIAIDWSGAKGRYSGIAVAECAPGRTAPTVVRPTGGRPWRREGVFEWLLTGLRGSDRLLIGIDCAFSLPWARAGGYGVRSGPELWTLVDDVCEAEPDHSGEPFTRHPGWAGHFWASGKRPAGYETVPRKTEIACRNAGLGAPESPYKLIGPKQVGKGALAGMRFLHRLSKAANDRFRVWPFDELSSERSAIVEIYPRLFLNKAGFGVSKVRSAADLNRCLDRLGSDPAEVAATILSDHETDALVSAAGLRLLAADVRLWSPPEGGRQEGWIFGVPQPVAAA